MKRKINSIIILSITVLVLGGILLPLEQAHAAGLGNLIADAIRNLIIGTIDIFSIPFALILMLLQALTGILPFIAAEMMKIAIATNETIPLIPSGAQDMVSVGWRFTRDMANMFFIVILAWAGLATILRLQTYEVKKILPKLIIIALLINFIPVIAGVILDISNIVTYYFAQRSSGAGEWLLERLPMNDIVRGGWESIIPGRGGITGAAVKSLMGIIFNLTAFFMLALYAVLFILRIVAIWVLLVLAPIAWLGYIIPNGKKYWDMWWKNFIQWSIIGIPLTFFLFLAGLVLRQSMSCESGAIDSNLDQYGFDTGVLAGITGELLCSILPFTAGIAVMLVGFLLSITFAPKGADTLIKEGRKRFQKGIDLTKKKTWSAAQDKLKTGTAAERIGQWAARKPGLGTVIGKPLLGYAEKRRDELERGEKEMQSWRSENIAAQIDRMPELQKAGALKVLAERGHANQITKDKQLKILKTAKAAGKEKDIIKFLPQYAGEIGFRGKTGTAAIDEALKAQKPEDVARLDKSIFTGDVLKRIPHVYSQEKLGKLASHGPEIINRVQGAFESEYRTNHDELLSNNAPGLRYLHSAMGSALFKPVGNLEEIEGKKKGGGTRPTPPAGVPPNWVPGPGGTWIPPSR